MSVLPAAPDAPPDSGADPGRTRRRCACWVGCISCGDGVWRTDGVQESSEHSPTPVIVTEHTVWR